MAEVKKPVWKNPLFWIVIVLWIIVLHWVLFPSDKTETTNPTVTPKQEKIDPVDSRISAINELYKDEPTFDKVEKFESDTIWIYFTETPDLWVEDSVDLITRWQAVNLSNEINGVASVKLFVWWKSQMYCVATKWKINECKDYR